ncbi:MAG: hypothetical protein EA344_07645, partial [Alkalicoccus sp.]
MGCLLIVLAMLKFADGWRNISLPTGRPAVEEIFSFLVLTPCGIFQSPSPRAGFRFVFAVKETSF